LSADLENGKVNVGAQHYEGPTGSAKVNIGVRPEHLTLSNDGLPMTVKVVEPTGSETMVFLDFEGQDVVAVFRDRHDFEPGLTIHLQPDPAHLHVFDANTGKRL